ncbi:MAG TPA: helicase-related protein, partial [Burkholderiaceae bacterium]|nr:helicase-related protein [Burkholderiaceae bacterium]
QQADHACSTAKSMASNLPRNGDLTQTELVLRSATETELGPMGLSLIEPTAGALPHNGDMLPAERRLAESLFQRSDGAKVIVATPTLAQGMNLPAQMAILAGDVRSDAKGRTDLKQHELLNAAGRAGRAGHLANGLVLLIPEPVVGFSALGLASAQSLEKLRSILPPNDQCVRIDDPLADLLDRIQAGAHAEPDVRYFMSRIRAGEPAEVANDVAVSLVQRSLAAFQARARHDEEVFAEKVVVLQLALAAEVESFDADAIRISAFTGMSAAALQAVSARLERELDNLPSTIAGWCDWLVDFLSTDPDAFVALLMNDADVINTITRGKKAGGPTAPEEFARLKAGLRAWVEGRPFDEIEIALGGPPGIASTCKRARDLTLKLANRRFSMIAAALAELAKLRLAAVGRQSENPAVLEIFAIAMRRGFDSAEKVAFAHRNPTIRTRVSLHRAFEKRMGAFTPLLGHSFRDVLSQVDLRMAFGAGDSDGA